MAWLPRASLKPRVSLNIIGQASGLNPTAYQPLLGLTEEGGSIIKYIFKYRRSPTSGVNFAIEFGADDNNGTAASLQKPSYELSLRLPAAQGKLTPYLKPG
ncbi:hypothetical protein PG987_011243 [Apiospora arundinis]